MNKVPSNNGKPRFNTLILMHPIYGIEAISEAVLLILSFPKAPFRRKGQKMIVNYCKLKKESENGIVKYYANVFSQWVEVSKEVYQFMEKSERKERYHHACCKKNGVLSLNRLIESQDRNIDFEPYEESLAVSSPEDDMIEAEMKQSDSKYSEAIGRAMRRLGKAEYMLLAEIVLEGKSIRGFAEEHGMSKKAVEYHYGQACKKLRKFYMEEINNGSVEE